MRKIMAEEYKRKIKTSYQMITLRIIDMPFRNHDNLKRLASV
jgi:hypothetical protein